MINVVDLTGHQSTKAAAVQPGVVSLLRDLLTQAEAGQIQHVACVWLNAQAVPYDAYSGGGDPQEVVALVGAVELFKHTVLDKIKDQ